MRHEREPAESGGVHSRNRICDSERLMSIGTILLVALLLLLLGAIPAWPYSRGWGYYPSGFVGVLLLVVIVLMLAGAFGNAALR
jgi:hypothetical protein